MGFHRPVEYHFELGVSSSYFRAHEECSELRTQVRPSSSCPDAKTLRNICNLHFPFGKDAKNMQKICKKYAKNMRNLGGLPDARNMQKHSVFCIIFAYFSHIFRIFFAYFLHIFCIFFAYFLHPGCPSPSPSPSPSCPLLFLLPLPCVQPHRLPKPIVGGPAKASSSSWNPLESAGA